MRTLTIILCSATLLFSCKKDTADKCIEVDCNVHGMSILLSSDHTVEELDTIYVAMYPANGQFSTPDSIKLYTIADTRMLGSDYGTLAGAISIRDLSLEAGTNYMVSIPGTAQTFRIQDIKDPPDATGTVCGDQNFGGCHAFVNESTISGGSYSVVPFWETKYNYGAYGILLKK